MGADMHVGPAMFDSELMIDEEEGPAMAEEGREGSGSGNSR